MTRRLLAIPAVLAFAAAIVLVVIVRQRAARNTTAPAQAVPVTAPVKPGRKIKALLFYVSMDGTKLTGVEREVAYGDGPAEQAQEIVNAQLAAAATPLVSAIPPGTTLRALYLNDKGEAYVDLSQEVSTAHTGGSQDEVLTIYTIVNALTTNLPAVKSVQLLVNGKEVDTLAGHIDLRKPLEKDLSLVEP
jgi:spore germination protein GerM